MLPMPPPAQNRPSSSVPSAEVELSSARTYVLAGLLFQAIFTSVDLYEFSPLGSYWLGWQVFGFLASGGGFMLVLGVYWGYFGVVQRNLRTARPVLLLLGALGFPFGLGIVGILYLVAWWKVGRAMRAAPAPGDIFLPTVPGPVPEVTRPPPMTVGSVPPVVYKSATAGTPLPSALATRRCPFCQADVPASSPVCPRCGGTEPPGSAPSSPP